MSNPLKKLNPKNLSKTQKMVIAYITLPFIVYFIFSSFFGNPDEADEYGMNVKPLFLCKRGPITSIVDKKISSRDPCSATAKIQSIRYKCTKPGDEAKTMREFLPVISDKAEARCKSFCKSVSPKCKARFSRPTSCGFKVALRKSQKLGDRVGCHFGCEGKSFAYCSIYHGGYISSTKYMLRKYSPNCRCSSY